MAQVTTAKTYLELGAHYQQQNRLSEAVRAYQTAVFYGYRETALLEQIADLSGEIGDWPAAIASYQTALLVTPTRADWHYKHGHSLVQASRHAEAIEACRKAIALQPEFVAAYFWMGNAFFALEQLDDAIAAYTQVITLDRSHRKAYQNLAAIFTLQNQAAGITFCHRQLNRLFNRSADRGLEDEGHVSAFKARMHSSDRPDSAHYYQLATDLFDAGQFGQAIAFYKIAQKLSPQDFEIAVQIQRSVEALANQSKANQSNANQTLSHTDISLLSPDEKNNNYTFIEKQVQTFIRSGQPYHLPVSIVIPTYNRKDKLAKMLAALTHQSYPTQLIEVIVADDGSSDGVEVVIQKYQPYLTLSHAWQPDEGFRLAKVCNLGIARAKYDNIILLQCDMVPRPQLVEAYMQYLHVSDQALLIGGRQFVNTDEVSDEQILNNVETALNLPEIRTQNEMWKGQKSWQDWRIAVYEKTDNLKTERYPHKAVVGSNLAFSKQMVKEIGGFCEDFCAWGGEDHEFGYRAYNVGYYFIPVKAAQCLHQEPPGGVNESDRQQGQKLAEAGCEEKCPLPLERKYQPHRIYEIPKVSVCILAFQDTKDLVSAIESVLSQTYTDLEVCVWVGGTAREQILDRLARYATHPRVRWTALEAHVREASNMMIQSAKGAYVGCLRLGNQLSADAVETWVKSLDDHDDGAGDRNEASFYLFRKRDWMRAARFGETYSIANIQPGAMPE